MDQNVPEILKRIRALERGLGDFQRTASDIAELQERLNTLDSEAQRQLERLPLPGHFNLLRNGDFDHHRNTFYYLTDYSGAATVDADVSEEAADWYTHPEDTMATSNYVDTVFKDATVTLSSAVKAQFDSGDAGGRIVIENGLAAEGSVELTGGASGSVDDITVDGVSIMDSPVNFNSSLTQTASDVATEINSTTSSPNYRADATGAVVSIYAVAPGIGSNGFAVVSSTTTITSADTNLAGGGDLETTIATYTDIDVVEVTNAPTIDLTGTRGLWRFQQLTEDVTDYDDQGAANSPDSNEATNTALKTPDHSRYSSDNPDYDRSNGWVRISASTYTLDAPFPDNLVRASKQYFIHFAHKLDPRVEDAAMTASDTELTSATAGFVAGDVGKDVVVYGAGPAGANLETTIATYNSTTSVELADAASTTVSDAVATFEATFASGFPAGLWVGFWDNTDFRQRFIEGPSLDLSASVVGTPASTTSRDYYVLALTTWGDTVGTDVVTVAGAPANGYFDATTYVELSWTPVVGAQHYEVYRKTGATYELLRIVYPNNSYFDNGTVYDTSPTAFPEATELRTRCKVYTKPSNFVPTGQWDSTVINMPVPAGYDQSKTTGKQWFRMGLTNAIAGAGMGRALLIDLISIDTRFGQFSRCSLDLNAKRPSPLTASSSDQGTVGGGGPVDPGGTDGCPTFDMVVDVAYQGVIRRMSAIALYELWEQDRSVKMINRIGNPVKITGMRITPNQVVYRLETESGLWLTASDTQPIFASGTDIRGKALKDLTFGATIQTKNGQEAVTSVRRINGRRSTVDISIEGPEKGYWMNGIAASNSKEINIE